MTKKVKVFIVLGVVLIICLSPFLLFRLSHSIDDRYNDWWILGKTREEVVARYGEFLDKEEYHYGEIRWEFAGFGTGGKNHGKEYTDEYRNREYEAYLLHKIQWDNWLPVECPYPEYYVIWFDEDGKAKQVKSITSLLGG